VTMSWAQEGHSPNTVEKKGIPCRKGGKRGERERYLRKTAKTRRDANFESNSSKKMGRKGRSFTRRQKRFTGVEEQCTSTYRRSVMKGEGLGQRISRKKEGEIQEKGCRVITSRCTPWWIKRLYRARVSE